MFKLNVFLIIFLSYVVVSNAATSVKCQIDVGAEKDLLHPINQDTICRDAKEEIETKFNLKIDSLNLVVHSRETYRVNMTFEAISGGFIINGSITEHWFYGDSYAVIRNP